jgi:hypothetical protein
MAAGVVTHLMDLSGLEAMLEEPEKGRRRLLGGGLK